MFIDFISVTAVFSIGVVISNLLYFAFARRLKWLIGSTITEFIILYGVFYMIMLEKNLSKLILFNLVFALFAALINLFFQTVLVVDRKPRQRFVNEAKNNERLAGKAFTLALAIFGLIVVFAVGRSIYRITSINEVYQSIETKTQKKAPLLTSTKEMPIALAPETAKRKMQQMFSVIPNSNMYELDGLTAQVVDGQYVYVATVEFNGFFKWLKNKSVPGYFIVSATDVNAQPKFIRKKMKYTPSAFFGDDAARRIYAEFPTYASSGKINLEISDDGTPYYIQTMYREYGVSGRMHFNELKTAVLNTITGDVKLYDAKKTPSFIDAPITASAASQMNEYYGRYVNGWLNQSWFGSKRGLKVPTENGIYASGKITPMLDKKGRLQYFTDFTSGNEDQDSALGYSLIDARSGQLIYYRDAKSGIMDSDGAISIADKIYPEKKWDAKMPVLYNIDGTPTWIISLLDSKGIFKKYVYINAVDNDIVVDADNAQDALDAYRLHLSTKGSNNQSTNSSKLKEFSGVALRVNQTFDGKRTIVSFLLDSQKVVFSINTDNYPYAQFLEAGDTVHFKANVTADTQFATIESLEIENLTK
ncbi:MAG: DNA-binding protein [Streptococcaceae bacterium]|jgi:hypothetical protein|nr:DNA-binding protein [Streptococcaceae bacterium]